MSPQNIAPFVAAHALSSLVLGLAIAVLVWIALRAMTRVSSAARFTVLYSALLSVLAVFFLRQPAGGSYVHHPAPFILSPSWAVYVLVVWFLLALLGIARIAVGLWRLRALRQTFIALNIPSLESVLKQRAGLAKRAVGLFHSPRVRVPAAIGFFKPAVVLPSWSLQELSPDELKAAVLHELAHVDRWDDWTNLAQKLVRALLFFHPAVWWLDSMLAIEREMSCDDAVLAQTGSPEQYAECLVSLAEKSFVKRPLLLAQAATGRIKQTAIRLSRILDRQERKAASPWKPALAALATFSVLGVVGVRHVPQLVVFQGRGSNAARIAQSKPPVGIVIPAGMRTSATNLAVPHEISLMSPATHVTAKRQTSRTDSGALAVRDSAPHSSIVNASARQPVPVQFMYVVMETRDYDGSGKVRITTSVWKLRFTTSVTVRAESFTPPHAT